MLKRPFHNYTVLQAIYVPADDLTDPSPATTFSHLDATTVLSRQVAELGFYPAVDPLESSSRIMDPNIVGLEHYDCARRVKKILQVSEASCKRYTGCPASYQQKNEKKLWQYAGKNDMLTSEMKVRRCALSNSPRKIK